MTNSPNVSTERLHLASNSDLVQLVIRSEVIHA